MTGFTITLTTAPPSLNNAFYNVVGKNICGGRRTSPAYKKWLTSAGWELKAQNPMPVTGQFGVECEIGRKLSRADLDNLAKPLIDLLVKQHVVPDDSKLAELAMRFTTRADLKLRVYAMEGP